MNASETATISLTGAITVDRGCQELRREIAALLEAGQTHIEIVMEEVEFADSAGLSAILACHRMARQKGGEVVLVRPSPELSRLLRLTRLDEIFTIRR